MTAPAPERTFREVITEVTLVHPHPEADIKPVVDQLVHVTRSYFESGFTQAIGRVTKLLLDDEQAGVPLDVQRIVAALSTAKPELPESLA